MPLPIHSSLSQPTGPAHVIAIAAGKGGVGKSTVTVNLALALSLAGYKVGILDADLYGPSLRRMLPEDQLPQQKGPTIVPAICQGIRVISMAYFRQDNLATAVRAPIANSLISQFLDQVEWGPLDYLLIDFPPGTGDIQLTLSQKAKLTGAVMVTTPQQVAIMDVRKAMHLFSQVRVPVLGIIENMSYYVHPGSGERLQLFGEGGGKRLAEETDIPFLGQIPVDPLLSTCGDEGRSLFAARSVAGDAFISLAKDVAAHTDRLKTDSENCLDNFELIWKEMATR
jgi:ATP-binding protein involved in chromosome partitioning